MSPLPGAEARRLIRRVRALKRLMPWRDAWRLATGGGVDGELHVHLTALRRSVVLRGATSDIHCFDKIWLHEEYRSEYPVRPRVIVDGGANVGLATLYFAARYPEARIVAVEPAADNFQILQRNCGTLPNVTVIQAALWPVERNLTLSNPSCEPWAFFVEENNSGGPTVPTVTIPQLLRIMEADRIDLLKLDIEGAERELFSTGSDLWLDRVRHIAIELHDRFKPGCARAFYGSLNGRPFSQEVSGENIFIDLTTSP